ncbi:hypothetical protein [Muriicola marianensis]|uniref:Uncharacterized protein n=1 Tax=Muriicola marianensis TaxID=1324801 RepID=A0ABQ1R8Y7_9FLAO|nr:hypothetical protein [Muriicola marianensis]GGD58889.1 hypothetical protein GCM10011361_26570 [Muriicola marianensis]
MKEIPKKNGFTTPPGYFEGLSERVLNKLEEKDTSALPSKEGFKIPEGYFDGLEEKIQDKTLQRETKVFTLKPFRPFLYAAAAIAVLVVLIIGLEKNNTSTPTFDDLAQAEITQYIESRDLELSSYELAEVLPVSELEIGDFMESSVDQDEILDYLEDSIDDLDELNIETHEEYQ